MKKYTIYCDMDGVIADFNAEANAVERFATEKDFFYNLKPIKKNLQALKELIKNNYDVYILSASPNKRADMDKIKWLKKYLPELKRGHKIIMRCGENKAKYLKTDCGILLDDFGKNIKEWTEMTANNRAFKIKNNNDIEKVLMRLERTY